MILLDSNVLIGLLFEAHPHYGESRALVDALPKQSALVAAHSLAETYSTITRPNRPYRLPGGAAWAIIDNLAEDFLIVVLDTAQHLDAIRRFSRLGTGPRLYDYLIGATAEAHGADTIVTWNTRDFDGLFPGLRIVTPAGFLSTPPPMPR